MSRSAWPTLHIGKPLSDRRIVYYAQRGRYGPALQAAWTPKTKVRAVPRIKTEKKRSHLQCILDEYK